MTRSDDVFISSLDKYRPNFANENQADLFISIHGNFSDAECIWDRDVLARLRIRRFAQVLHRHILQVAGLRDRCAQGRPICPKYTNMARFCWKLVILPILRRRNLFDDEFQRSLAKAIARGVRNT